mgnify:CR=1 FL=1
MTTNIEAWNKIIKGLMPDMDISVTEAGGNLIVRSEDDLSALQSILQKSPDTIQDALAWELRQADAQLRDPTSRQPSRQIKSSLLEKVHAEADEATFARVIHKTFTEERNLGMPLSCKLEDGLLTVRADLNKLNIFRQDAAADLMYAELCDWFRGLSPQKLLSLLCELPEPTVIDSAEDSEKWEKYKEAIMQHCERGRCIKFNMQLLKQLALPPLSTLDTHEDTLDGEHTKCIYTLTIDIQHLFNYLSRARDWIVVQDNDAETATPILFAKPLGQCAKKIHLMLYLDDSASLSSVKDEYESAVGALMNKFRETFHDRQNDLTISYRTFGNHVSEKKMLSLGDEVCLGLYSQTALYSALIQANSDITSWPEEEVSVMILITDGKDTVRGSKPEQNQLDGMSRYEGNVYIVGLGHEYDSAICEDIAQLTGGSHLKIDSLLTLSDKISDMSDFYSFYKVTIGDNPDLRVRVSQSAQLHALPSVGDGAHIKINGTDYVVKTVPISSPAASTDGQDSDDELDVDPAQEGYDEDITNNPNKSCRVM